jgi:hypothetical protein
MSSSSLGISRTAYCRPASETVTLLSKPDRQNPLFTLIFRFTGGNVGLDVPGAVDWQDFRLFGPKPVGQCARSLVR